VCPKSETPKHLAITAGNLNQDRLNAVKHWLKHNLFGGGNKFGILVISTCSNTVDDVGEYHVSKSYQKLKYVCAVCKKVNIFNGTGNSKHKIQCK